MSLPTKMSMVTLASHVSEIPWVEVKPEWVGGIPSLTLLSDVTDDFKVSFVTGTPGTTASPTAADTAREAEMAHVALTDGVPFKFDDGITGAVFIRKAVAAASVRLVSAVY